MKTIFKKKGFLAVLVIVLAVSLDIRKYIAKK